jgi:hypothetical protein
MRVYALTGKTLVARMVAACVHDAANIEVINKVATQHLNHLLVHIEKRAICFSN